MRVCTCSGRGVEVGQDTVWPQGQLQTAPGMPLQEWFAKPGLRMDQIILKGEKAALVRWVVAWMTRIGYIHSTKILMM